MEGGKVLSRCPGEGKIHAAKTRRVIDREGAHSAPPQSDPGNFRKSLQIQTDDRFNLRGLSTKRATEK